MKNLILFLGLSILFFSCNNKKEKNHLEEQLIRIPLSCAKDQVLNLSEFADSIDVIPLETKDECLIGWIPRIIATDDRYYISSAIGYKHRKLLVFDKQGRFIRQIGKEGQGPKEYIELKDFSVFNDSIIKITEVYNMISYDKDGNFIRKVKQKETPLAMLSLKGKTFVPTFRPTLCNDKLLAVLDSEDKFVSHQITVSSVAAKVADYYVMDAGFTNDENNIYYTYPFSHIVYKLDVETLENVPYFYLDYGKREASWNIFEENDDNQTWTEKQQRNNEYMKINEILNVGNKFVFNSVDDEVLCYFAIYSKKTGKILSGQKIKDDMFFKGNLVKLRNHMTPHNCEGEYLLWAIQPEILLNGYHAYRKALGETKWKLFRQKFPSLVEVCEQLDEDSNPVLLKIKLKEF